MQEGRLRSSNYLWILEDMSRRRGVICEVYLRMSGHLTIGQMNSRTSYFMINCPRSLIWRWKGQNINVNISVSRRSYFAKMVEISPAFSPIDTIWLITCAIVN